MAYYIVLAVCAAFVIAMLVLTGVILTSPVTVTQSCSTSTSSTWAFLTILASIGGLIVLGALGAEGRNR